MRFAVAIDYRMVIDLHRGYAVTCEPCFTVGHRPFSDPFTAAQALEAEWGRGPSWRLSRNGSSAVFLNAYLSVRKSGRYFTAYRDGCPLIDVDSKRVIKFDTLQMAQSCARGSFDADFDAELDYGETGFRWRGAPPVGEVERFWEMEICPKSGEVTYIGALGATDEQEEAILPVAKIISWRHRVADTLARLFNCPETEELMFARRLYGLQKSTPTGEDFVDVCRSLGSIRMRQGATTAPIRFGWDVSSDPLRSVRPHHQFVAYVNETLQKYISIIKGNK